MIELLEQQKKLTSNQWKLICTANVADLLDFFDFFLIGYVTAALTKEWSLPYWQGGAIAAQPGRPDLRHIGPGDRIDGAAEKGSGYQQHVEQRPGANEDIIEITCRHRKQRRHYAGQRAGAAAPE